MRRRRLLQWAVNGLGAAMALVAAAPAVIMALSPAWRARRVVGVWTLVGRVDAFAVNEVSGAVVWTPRGDGSGRSVEQRVYVYRRAMDDWVVFSRSCTDLGCPVTFEPGSQCYFCPCHGGIFDKDGEPIAGPPKHGLFRFAYRVVDGRLEIDLGSVPPMV